LADSGTIIAQAPLPGQLLRPGKAVRVTVSLGPERRAIPDVVGLRETWAFNLLESAGFVVIRDTLEASEPRGTVVALNPEAGTELPLPAEITVSVSLGPPLVAMPRVLGMAEAEARDTLEALGLTVLDVQEVFRFGRSRGIVVEQAPPADSLLEVGSEVRFSIGRGRGR
jgi:serine/threonine-protein kinase